MSPYVEDLLKRIKGYLDAERMVRSEGQTYHERHPVTLLSEAYGLIYADECLIERHDLGEFIR